jgi:Na+/citrate or Na+/malate symporter
MLRYSLGLKEFQLYDSYQISNGQFESYCIDKLKDFMDGKDVDFTELYEAILIAGDFLESEKKLLKKSDIEERLWAIYLAIIDQDNKHNI